MEQLWLKRVQIEGTSSLVLQNLSSLVLQKGGCKRGLAGNSSSVNIPYHVCKTCQYFLCDKCTEIKMKNKKEATNAKIIKSPGTQIKCKKGHKLVLRKPNNSGWFCDASCEVRMIL